MATRRISEFPAIAGADIDESDLLTLVHIFEVDPTLRNKKITFTEFRNYLDRYYINLSGEVIPGNITISGNLTVTGATNLNTVTGNTATFTTSSGTTANFVSGVFTTQLSGTTVTGQTANFLSGVFQNFVAINQTFGSQTISGDITVLSGVYVSGQSYFANNISVTGTISGQTVTGTTAQFTTVSGTTVTGNTGRFTTLTGGTAGFTTITGTTITGGTGQFTTLTGGTAGFTTVTGTTVTGDTGAFTNITGNTLFITAPSGATPAVICSGVVSGSTSGFIIKGPLIIL